jgi:predicted kinase
MRGLSGSGKSYISSRLIGELQAVRIRSDLERKRLYQVAELGRSGSEVGEGIYSVEASRKTFEEVERLTRTVLSAGYHTIVDATFLKTDLVQRFRAVAATCGVQVRILDVRAPEKLLRERLSLRAEKGRDVSEADQSVLTELL